MTNQDQSHTRTIDPSSLDHATLAALVARGRRERSAAAHALLARLLGARDRRTETSGLPLGV